MLPEKTQLKKYVKQWNDNFIGLMRLMRKTPQIIAVMRRVSWYSGGCL